MAARIRKGDTVEVLVGKNHGARGTVLRVDRQAGKVIIEGVNVVKRHVRPSAQTGRGGIVEKEAPLPISNVALIHKDERTRVGFRVVDGNRVRWSRKHDEAIDG
jgi:large subunit ribosomal protein L24